MASLRRCGALVATVCGLTVLTACGGGGGGGGDGGGGSGPSAAPSSRATTFTGNLRSASAVQATGDSVAIALGPVQVCVAGTSFCAEVDDSGAFTLAADIGGDVVLLFDGPNFTARLPLNDVPRGATVRIVNIECSTVTGRCQAENVEIVNPMNEPPVCDAAQARPDVLWPPDHGMVNIAIVGVSDPDGDPVDVRATSVTSDEPVDAPGSGNTAPDAQLNPLAVRAERSGQGNGRIYIIEFVADDNHGGTCTGVVRVCVPHDQGHGSVCG